MIYIDGRNNIMLDTEKIGGKIILLRKEKGLTAEKLAEILEITPQAVSKWETGKNLPETSILPKLSDVLGCSIDTILKPKELHILSAVYTDGFQYIDVTKFVDSLVDGNKINISVSGKSLGLQLDEEKVKLLTVKYQTPSGIFICFALENNILSVTADNTGGERLDKPFEIIGAFYGSSSYYRDCTEKVSRHDFLKSDEIKVDHVFFPSSPASDDTEYLTIIYKNKTGIYAVSCPENESLKWNENKTALYHSRSSDKMFLPGIVRLEWQNNMDCTWAGALYAALKYMGESITYEYIMGVSGACYRFAFNPSWDYNSVDALISFDYKTPAMKALGYNNHYSYWNKEKSERPKERKNITRDIKAGKPLIALKLRIANDWGVITGYLENGKYLLCRTYFDKDVFAENPNYGCDQGGYISSDFFPVGIEHFGEKTQRPSEKENLIQSLKTLIASANAEKSWGKYYSGFDGFKKWIEELRNVRNSKEGYTKIISVNDFQLLNLIDARRCAATYLEEHADILEGDKAGKVKEISGIYKKITEKLSVFHKSLRDITYGDKSENIKYNCMEIRKVNADELQTQAELLEWQLRQERRAVSLSEQILNYIK